MGLTIDVASTVWKPCWRIAPGRFPPIQLFERVSEPDDLEAVFELESLTNTRLRDEVGDIRLVPSDERISGPGTSIIMAAFTHLNPEGSRFSDGTHGVPYAAKDLDTAIAETKHHHERFMNATNQERMELDMRAYAIDANGAFHDLREQRPAQPLVYLNDSHTAGQHLAKALRKDGSNGIVYDSLRQEHGECIAVFRPRLLSNARQDRHLCHVWNGERIESVYEKRKLGNTGFP